MLRVISLWIDPAGVPKACKLMLDSSRCLIYVQLVGHGHRLTFILAGPMPPYPIYKIHTPKKRSCIGALYFWWGMAHVLSCIQASNMLKKNNMACIFQLHVAVFWSHQPVVVLSSTFMLMMHGTWHRKANGCLNGLSWSFSPKILWLIMLLLWYQYISTCFPHVGTNPGFFPRFQPADIWASHLYTTSWTWQARQENSLPWICCLDMSRQWCLVFQHVISLWGNPCLAILKKSKKTLKKKTYMWARFSDICQCQSVSCHFVCYFLCGSWMVSGRCFAWEARTPDRQGSVPDRGSR